MTAIEMSSRFARTAMLVAALLASACGGGGGSGSSSGGSSSGGSNPPPGVTAYTLSTTTVRQTHSVLEVDPVFTEISVTIPNAALVPFGLGGRYSDTGLASVVWDAHTQKLTLYFKVPAGVAPGSYSDTVTIGACEDATCNTQKPGTISTISASYTITAATLPSYTLSASTVNVSAIAGDVNPVPPQYVNLLVTNPAPFTPAGQSTSTTKNGVYSVEYSATSFAPLRFVITMKTPYTLAPGTYTDTVTVRMCLYGDYGCQNPLTVTPSTITVNYTISDTVPGPAGFTAKLSPAFANDVAWDGTRGLLYLSVPKTATDRAATITEFNPVTNTFGASVPAGPDPNLVAISDDDQFLYVADKALGEIRRFKLGPLTPDITIPLGNDTQYPAHYPLVAHDLQVAPGRPHVIAVSRWVPQITSGDRGVVVLDDATARPTAWDDGGPFLQWGSDATRLYTNGRVASVDASGVVLLSSYPAVSGNMTKVGNRVFGDFGQVTDVTTATSLGPITLDGWFQNIASNPAAGRVYWLTNSRTNSSTQIETYDAATLDLVGIGRLPAFQISQNSAARAKRFGANGLAIVTQSGEVVLVTGPLIAP